MKYLSYDDFEKIIKNRQEFSKISNDLENNFCISIIDSPISNYYSELFDFILKIYFNEDGLELIDWWLFEDVEKIVYDDGKKIDLTALKDLYNYLITSKITKSAYLND